MKYITFHSNKLSKLSLGTVQFGLNYGIANKDGKPTQENVNEIIDYLYNNGINCFDTAQAYGSSEEVLGISLDNKEHAFVVSKLKSDMFINLAKKNVLKSLTNLKLNALYGLLLHDSELLYKWEEQHSTIVDELIKSGLVKYFGVSIYTSEDFRLAIENDKITFIQIPFNLFDQRATREKWFEKARKNNKLIFIRSVFLQGVLLMDVCDIPKKLDMVKPYIEQINILCDELQCTKNELALNFVDSSSKDALMLFGCDNLKQAKENLATYNCLKNLDSSTLEKIDKLFENIDENIYNPAKW